MRTKMAKRIAGAFLLTSMWIWDGSIARADDTYYMVIFAYQGKPNLPKSAHTFATFLKVPDGKGGKPDFTRAKSHTISWMPASLVVVPLRPRQEQGKNLDLGETLQLAVAQNADISAWGPVQIRKELFDAAVKQIARLNSGEIAYKALDGKFRPGAATNCFHAVSDIVEGPLLDTGAAFGDAASVMVRDHLGRWIIEPTRIHREAIPVLGVDRRPIRFHDDDKRKEAR
jgi:hypothetical protein